MRELISRVLLLCGLMAAVPAVASAQALAGMVRDASGGVLPGVTVEAASPALIEKVRVVATDSSGQYRIVDLRPGTYTLTFTLPGFTTVARTGVELSGSGTVTVNSDMTVGGLEETITVAGETPVVDVQSAVRQTVMSGDLVASVPAARSWNGLLLLMPGVTGTSNAMQLTPSMITFGIHGGPTSEGRLLVGGMNVGASRGGGGVSGYQVNTGNVEEVTFATSGGLGEVETGGPYMNIVPKTGGNIFSGGSAFFYANQSLQGDNYTDKLRDAGLRSPGELLDLWDVDGSLGGPIKRDQLWFFFVGRNQGNSMSVPGMFANLNAGDPNAWTYEPDLSRPARTAGKTRSGAMRLTWQISPKNKLTGFWDEQWGCSGARWPGSTAGSACRDNTSGWIIGGSATAAPETATYSTPPNRITQVNWVDTISTRALLDVGWSAYNNRWGGGPAPGNPTNNLIAVQEQGGSIPGLCYRSYSPACGDKSTGWISSNTWKAHFSYVTGAHNMKLGYNGLWNYDSQESNPTPPAAVQYRFNNGVPNQITQFSGMFESQWRTRFDAVFVQDQWTLKRLTLQGGLRYDHAWSYYPNARIGGTRFFPELTVIDRADGVNFHNISPRGGAAYDLFGTGRTSIKANWGRYLYPAQNGGIFTGAAPTSQIATRADRSWTDANRNYIPDCDVLNPDAQDLRASGGDVCGRVANRNFGTLNAGLSYSEELLNGLRPWDTQVGVALQHEILPRISAEVQFNKRWWYGQYVTRNLAVNGSDFTRYSITAPSDPRLPGGGGYTISGLHDVDPRLFGVIDYQVQPASRYGDYGHHWNGVDVTINARTRNGLTLQGGTSTGQTVMDFCEVAEQVPESLVPPQTVTIGVSIPGPSGLGVNQSGAMPMQYCHLASGFLTGLRGLGSYLVPKVDVEVSTTFRSNPGVQLAANYNVPATVVGQSLGRAPSGGVANVTVNLVEPGTLYGDRVNQMDMRVAKLVRVGRTRTKLQVDFYNLLNAATVLTYNQVYNPNTTTWLTPTSVLDARVAKLGATIDF
jgi:hypothetical protein